MVMTLNVISAVAAFAATILGLSSAKKFCCGFPTRKGWTLIALALTMTATQVKVQWIRTSEKEAAEERAAIIKSAVTRAYSGWVKAGNYVNGRWEKPLLLLDKPPGQLKVGDVVSVGSRDAYFLNIHRERPPRCDPPAQWFSSTTVNVLGRGTLVKVLDWEMPTGCPSGRTEVWVKVEPFV